MSTAFEQAFEELLRYEGFYSNDSNDPGGETKYGISKRSYPDLDIAHLTLEEAKEIYRRDFWTKLYLDQVRDEIAREIFEQAVNLGPVVAVKNTQRALCLLRSKVAVDGVMGPETVWAVNHYANSEILLKVLNGLQLHHYIEVTEQNPELVKFFKGWLRRVG